MSDNTVYPVVAHSDPVGQNKKDFESSQDVRWCPGCGDYSILAQVQRLLPALGIPKENYVFVSGIGCSSRFPYYMGTYGLHTIHGRAPAFVTGIKSARPELSVWMVTGDGDGLSIGAGQLMHILRRNVDVKILLFNNQIYGLTKGQYSPTSPVGLKTKSTPLGSIDAPIDPISVALGAGATFVARTVDINVKHMQSVLARAAAHKGTAFVEILQNCPIFNDGAFGHITDKTTKFDHQLEVENGKPLRFGLDGHKGIALGPDMKPCIVEVAAHGEENLLKADEDNELFALLASRLRHPDFPVPLGVLRAVSRPTYDGQLNDQVTYAKSKRKGNVQELLNKGAWTVS